MDNDNAKLLEELLIEINKLRTHNKIFAEQISIAKQGLEVIISMGDSMNESVAKQTIGAMVECENKDSSQDRDID